MPCWRSAKTTVMCRCHAQMRIARRARVPASKRLMAIDAILFPVIAYRAPSWAPSAQLLAEADALQRRYAATAVDVAQFPLEEPVAYRWRRGRIAAVVLALTRPWSARILESAAARFRFLRSRDSFPAIWSAAVSRTRDAAWMSARCVWSGSGSAYAGRIHARSVPGCVPPRYEETMLEAARLAGIPL